MPTLKDLVCHVQWADTGSAFPEYGTVYGDGVVETYIAIPSHPQAFTIRLTSRKFIYAGLSMVVFIDGNYQCNRNRVNLQLAKKGVPDNRTNVDFLVRQKEKPMGDGTYMGREWRFDDCNLVSQMPEGMDKSHFDELGTIEVLVLRCQSTHCDESQCSTTSSAEHSGIMDDDEDAREEEQAGDSGSQSKTENPSTQPEPPQTEVQDAFGGMFGLFDGPADGWPFFPANPGDAPSDGYPRWHWQPPHGHSAPYGPQERPQPPPDYRPASEHYGEPRRSRYDYHDSPPSSAYAHPPPGRSDRHVHFDYGDRRGPPPSSYHPRYDHQSHHTWERDDPHGYSQPRPSYHRPEYHRHRNPYPEYSTTPEGGHYMYHADRKVYSQCPDSDQIHGSSHPHAPLASQPTHHPYYPTPIQGVSHGPHQVPGPPTFAASQANVPNSAPSMSPFPPLPPKIPIQPTDLRPIQPQPVQYPIPIWVGPPPMPVPPFPPAMPIYPPPGNAPLFHTQRIDASNVPSTQNGSTSTPGAVPGEPNGSTSQQQGGDNAKNVENNSPNIVLPGSAEDPPQNRNIGNHNGEWGTSDGKNISGPQNTWANGGLNNNGGNSNTQNPNDSGDMDNKSTSCNNNRNSDNLGEGWDNDNSNPGGGSWQNEPAQTPSGNTQSNNGDGWAAENHNPSIDGNGQAWNGNNNQNNGSTSNNEPAFGRNPSNSRPLYGPHGAYYASKASVQNDPPAEAEEEPRYDVPQAIAQSMGITKQVQSGKGYLYNKKRCIPHYMDTLDEPYARFVFKYRTKEQLKNEIGVEITAEPSPNEDVNALENLDKAELIQMVLRAKGALGGTIPSPPSKVTPPSVKSFEQVPVDAPDMAFLRYNLPRTRNVSNTAGLGIRLSNASSNQSNSGNAQQNNNWNNGGSQNWGNGSNSNSNNNNNGNNSNGAGWNNAEATNKNGWDGQQEKQPSVAASRRTRNFSAQAPSWRSSMISPKGLHPAQARARGQGSHAGPSGDMLDYVLSNPEAAARMGMAGPPPPPPPPIAFTGSGTIGGGQTNIDMGISGAGPRPPTPTGPPPPCSPLSVQNQGAFGPGSWGGENPAQPANGW